MKNKDKRKETNNNNIKIKINSIQKKGGKKGVERKRNFFFFFNIYKYIYICMYE